MSIIEKLELLSKAKRLGLSTEHLDILSDLKVLCKSKFGEPRYFEKQEDGSYLIYGRSVYISSVEDGTFYFDGGPHIHTGSTIDKLGIVENVVYWDEGSDGFTCCKVTIRNK